MLGTTLSLLLATASAQTSAPMRPPAVPLVTSDPYLSIWSEADHLTDDVTRHWTHRPNPLISLIRIDGQTFRLMGNAPDEAPVLPQTSLTVTATKSSYQFSNGHIAVTLTFLTPALPDNLDVLTRPVTYLNWQVSSADGSPHKVSLFDSTGSELAVNETTQPVDWKLESMGPLTSLRVGSDAQTLLRPAGDDTRIDWGYAYAVANTLQSKAAIADSGALVQAFEQTGEVPVGQDVRMPRPVDSGHPALAFTFDLGTVGSTPVERQVMIGYDELYSIDYFGEKLRPYWRRNGATPETLFRTAAVEYATLKAKCEAFDSELTADATKAGGAKYAQIVSLSYRECLAAVGIAADSLGSPLLFTKENTSNGDIATVDVIFPMDPIWVLLSPTLAKASLESNFAYAASPHWKFPNAPHDLGTYPQVFGRDDGGEGMPVEESGNMIILTDAIAQEEGNASYAKRWWPQLTQWAKYLEKYGLDPEDQLCTDDFMGHLAHNANLSVKAIVALAAYGDLCERLGDHATAKKYITEAKTDAVHWVQVADAGDHSLLAFDKPNTWSQKYNLVWDHLLGLNVFPADVARKEIAYYQKVIQQFGVPLDSRTHLTKTDWSVWSATMATSEKDFESIVDPIYAYLNQTSARDPIADSYETDNVQSGGMHARPVVGGLFIKLLSDPVVWKKWASRDHLAVRKWAPLPKPPVVKEIVPTGRNAQVLWKYTTKQPAATWTDPTFDDSMWSQGNAGFGTPGTPSVKVRTNWNTGDIWIRRTLTLPPGDYSKAQIVVFHDEDVEVYFDGVLAASEPSYITDYELIDIAQAAAKLLQPGAKVTIAVHCHQTTGGQGIDVGIAEVKR